jgi:hypothetical protein
MKDCYKVFTFLFLLIIVNGCKPDQAIYPTKTVPIPGYTDTTDNGEGTGPGTNPGTDPGTGTNPGSGTNNGDGLSLGPVNTIKIQVDGVTTTYNKTVTFSTYFPNSPDAILSPSTGQTTIFGLGANSTSDIFTLTFLNSKTGTFDITEVTANNYSDIQENEGKVKVTSLTYSNNKGTLQGTFSADLTDDKGKVHTHALGSFNIKI